MNHSPARSAPLRISIVTPNFNGGRFLEQTIRSVIDQGYPNLEYIFVDGGSTDDSMAIVQRYAKHFSHIVCEKDEGHADAVNKGLRLATGDVLAWINSDDLLLPGSLARVNQVFGAFPEVSWLTGRASSADEAGTVSAPRPLKSWTWVRFVSGDFRHIQQESTFWRRSLWQQAGGELDLQYELANDFELWLRFFQHALLFSVDAPLGCFRFRTGQRSIAFAADYEDECELALRRFIDALPAAMLSRHLNLYPPAQLLSRRKRPSALPEALAATDSPVIVFDPASNEPVMSAPGNTNLPKNFTPQHQAFEDLLFDGLERVLWKSGPDFAAADLVDAEVDLMPFSPMAIVPGGMSDSIPPMPLVIGPMALYEHGAGRYSLRIKFADGSVSHDLRIGEAGNSHRLKVCLSAERYAVFLDGQAIAAEPTTSAQQMQSRHALLGGGFVERFWVGGLGRVRVSVAARGAGAKRWAQPVTHELSHREGVRVQPREARLPTVLQMAPRVEPGSRATPLSAFRNRHRGQRCFVMGNGPSLNKMNLDLLAGEIVFACNASFLLFDRVSWRPTYYTCVDTRVVRDRAAEIRAMLDSHPAITAFFPATVHLHDGSGAVFDGRDIIPPGANRHYFNEVGNRETNHPETMFSLEADDFVVQPYTVAITMLQLAAFMGFDEIYLIGCDTSYKVQDSVKQEGRAIDGVGLLLTSTRDDDANHFDPRYFGQGREWHNPQVSKMLNHYRWAQLALRRTGTRVFNATVGGQLEVFPRVAFDSLFPHRPPGALRQHLAPAPLLSIAIPAYGRPGSLLHALQSFIAQIQGRFEDEVEIVVSDDCSPDNTLQPVAELAARHRFMRYRRYEKNIGLEANLLACQQGCRGEFLWIFGDDDYLEANDALERILAHLRLGRFDALVLNRTRRSTDLSQLISPNWMQLDPALETPFAGLREFCLRFGFISVLGFISVNILRRRQLARVDAAKYLGTMYPQLGAMLEAFAERPVLLIGAPLVCHRTQTAEEKRAALGNKASESDFMADARRRNALYFSHPYVAMLDELVARGAFSPEDIPCIPENTVINGPLLDFLVNCVCLNDELKAPTSDEAWTRTACFFSGLQLSDAQRASIGPVLARHGCALVVPGQVPRLTISVVTPSFNQAEFLPDCLKSVRDQTYPAIEHLVFDPGSKDGSREIAAGFPHVTLFAEADKGQSDALNKGFSRVRGDVIAWLNSDDMLTDPKVFERVIARFSQPDAPDIVYGKGVYVDEAGAKLRDAYINNDPSSLKWRFHQEDGIMQPALFMRRSVVERAGPLRNDLHFSMDYEYWIRCMKLGMRFAFIDSVLAIARYHLNNKTYGQRGSSYGEVCRMVKEHFGYVSPVWLKRFAEFLADGHDGVLAHAGNAGVNDKAKLQRAYVELMKEHNGDAKTLALMRERQSERGYGEALREMTSLGLEVTPAPTPALCGPFERERHCHLDETACVATLFATPLQGSVMIDVGAHHGLSLAPFLDMCWQVFAFEPDPDNRAKLMERLGKHRLGSTVRVDVRAVTKEAGRSLPYFRSDVSTGISGLSAFHESHVESQRVDTVTLREFMAAHRVGAVDFLKIDTEGHDLFVLQGFPWEAQRPMVVECEFEDAKTVPLGYTFHDLARYLVERGYVVYASEWHPIVRYGTRHDWRALRRYPCELSDDADWGNLVAFRDPIDEQIVVDVFARACGAVPSAASATRKSSPDSRPQILAGRGFTRSEDRRWQFAADVSDKERLWAAVFAFTQPSEYLGGVTITASAPVRIRLTFGRHGNTPWEGLSRDLTLAGGKAEALYLRHRFVVAHEALKVQIEVLDAFGAGRVDFSLDNVLVVETLAGIESRLPVDGLRLRSANQLLRQGAAVSALGIYLLLDRQNGLRMYRDNADIAARHLGLDLQRHPLDLAALLA